MANSYRMARYDNRPIKVSMGVLRLDSGGYAPDGQYFGRVSGTRVYRYSGEREPDTDGDWPYVLGDVRASDRESAKAQVRADYPGVRFYR